MKTCIVIPARLHSTRLPEKLLLCETGKTLIQHTFEAASASHVADFVVVATDSERIVDVVESFGGAAVLTDPNHPSGTDRVAEFAINHPEFDCLINVQGDEPEIEPSTIECVHRVLQENGDVGMSTAACRIESPDLLADPNCVKVVLDQRSRAMYFSRAPIPCNREDSKSLTESHFQHLGIYAYRREFLLAMNRLPASELEQVEKLEQLRVLESGNPIQVGVVERAVPGIDTEADYRAFVSRLANC